MRVVHISDFHLPSRTDKQVNGVHPYENLKRAVGEIKLQNPKPDLVILGGDCFEEGEKGNYRTVMELFEGLQVPVHAVMGNHDHLPTLKKTSGLPLEGDCPGYNSFDHSGVHFVILNSVVNGKPHGRLEEEQLLWLNADLHEHRLEPVLIFLHHPPVDSGVAWLDKMRLLNAENFWGVIPPFSRNIKGVFASHLHIALTCCYRQILLATTPGTCWQYAAGADAAKAALSGEPPGFNVIDVGKTQVSVRTVRYPAVSTADLQSMPSEAEKPAAQPDQQPRPDPASPGGFSATAGSGGL